MKSSIICSQHLIQAIVLTIFSMLAVNASAHEYTCKNNEVTRKISVVHEGDQEAPCVVKYDKSEETGISYPWSAKNDGHYCKQKASYLATRLESFGWQCEERD